MDGSEARPLMPPSCVAAEYWHPASDASRIKPRISWRRARSDAIHDGDSGEASDESSDATDTPGGTLTTSSVEWGREEPILTALPEEDSATSIAATTGKNQATANRPTAKLTRNYEEFSKGTAAPMVPCSPSRHQRSVSGQPWEQGMTRWKKTLSSSSLVQVGGLCEGKEFSANPTKHL